MGYSSSELNIIVAIKHLMYSGLSWKHLTAAYETTPLRIYKLSELNILNRMTLLLIYFKRRILVVLTTFKSIQITLTYI